MNKKTKSVLIAVVALAAICALIFTYANLNAQHPRLTGLRIVDGDGGAIYSIDSCSVITVGDSLRFRIDTGSQTSTILPADLDRLRAMGMRVKESKFPSTALDNVGNPYLTFTRYTTELPVYRVTYVPDPHDANVDGRFLPKGKPVARIADVVFLPAAPDDTISIIGSDILEHFCIEYQWRNKALAFRRAVPSNYQEISRMKAPFEWKAAIGNGRRYYIPCSVQNNPQSYFLDTAIEEVDIKLPESDTVMVRQDLRLAVFNSASGLIRGHYTPGVWVRIGNRQGTHAAYFGDDGREPYALNPLKFYTQDIVIDFPHRRLYLHPTAE